MALALRFFLVLFFMFGSALSAVPSVSLSYVSFSQNDADTIYKNLLKIGVDLNQLGLGSSAIPTDIPKVYMLTFRYVVLGSDFLLNPSLSLDQETLKTAQVTVKGAPLFYPSPLGQRYSGRPMIQYELNKDASIEIRIYDMKGSQIWREQCSAGAIGGVQGKNIYYLDKDNFAWNQLPSGPYFYLVMNENRVISKGKFAVIP